MKKSIIFILLLTALPSYVLSMEEKPTFSKEEQKEAGKLFWDSFSAYQNGKIPFNEYRDNLTAAIPLLDYTQDHYGNPLVDAVFEGDYDFAKFLLDHGASPVFRGMNQMNGFDALRLKDSKIFGNPDAIKMFEDLLTSYLKPGEQRTPYRGGSGNYFSDWELAEFNRKRGAE